MNDLLRAGLIFLSGAAAGAGITWYFTKEYYKKIADEEIESVKEIARRKNYEAAEKLEDYKNEKEILEKAIKDSGLSIYSNDDREDGPPEDSTEVENKLYRSSPYFIDEEQFSTEALHYEKTELRYYAEDNIFCDENDAVFPDDEFGSILIDEIMEEFYHGIGSETGGLIYIRNDNLQKDYEVQLINNSYKEAVLGVKEE